MKNFGEIKFSLPVDFVKKMTSFFEKYHVWIMMIFISVLSIANFIHYYYNGLGLAYNDARSHLDIGRRVVEGLKPGLAQIGSVWLPLPHLLMVPTIWSDFMWHTGLSGAIQSMISFVLTSLLIYLYLKHLGVGIFGRLIGMIIFITNINILYLQSTAMTELLLIATMTAASYYLLLWFEKEHIFDLIFSSFLVMASTLIRYDGWFLLFMVTVLVVSYNWKKYGYKAAEGTFFLFCTLGGLGVILWVLWNFLIFGDPLYFAFGEYSAHAQQTQLADAGVLATEHNLALSTKIYLYAMIFNSYFYVVFIGIISAFLLFIDKKLPGRLKLASLSLIAPLFFNILALCLGHSVLFVQGISGDTWFNVRYGIMLVPSIAIFVGYFFDKITKLRVPIILSLAFVIIFAFVSVDAVTIDDGRVGSSQKNVTEVSNWLRDNAKDKEGFVLISAASHDAIIFSSTLPMKKFIHEGTGKYWESATTTPDHWARWIIMRTNDNNDQTFRLVNKTPGFNYYNLIKSYPFADIYELDAEHHKKLNTKPILKNNK